MFDKNPADGSRRIVQIQAMHAQVGWIRNIRGGLPQRRGRARSTFRDLSAFRLRRAMELRREDVGLSVPRLALPP